MVIALRSNEIDLAVGLTEGFVAGLAKTSGYKLVGTYVTSSLRWAISTGPQRENVNGVKTLKNGKIGVSRLGSGSHVMGYVLADQEGWLREGKKEPFEIIPLQTFEHLRNGVRDETVDFFLWEHFTTKSYHDDGSIRRIGEISSPWPSWHVAARTEVVDEKLDAVWEAVDKGVQYFWENEEEVVGLIGELGYSEEDARAWLKTVTFAEGTKGVSEDVVKGCRDILVKAGVMKEDEGDVEAMIGVKK